MTTQQQENVQSEQHLAAAPTHCNYYVTRKKRYCRLSPNEGEEYCAEHKAPLTLNAEDIATVSKESKVRIPCPLDSKHTCFAHKLKKHLKICNARQETIPIFIQQNVNSGFDESPELCPSSQTLSSLTPQEIKALIEKIKNIYADHIDGQILEKILKHSIVENEMQKDDCGNKTKKHLKQVSCILKLLEEYHLLGDNTCLIEFGAGRGQLSFWVAKASNIFKSVSILLVEKASPKHKHDNKLNKCNNQLQVQIERIRADIKDLVLDKLEVINGTNNIVAVTKHLCGSATDLALRCITNVRDNKQKVKGVVMTFCCHHRCQWTPYVGKTFFKNVGLDQKEFQIMCGMASWATCGTGFSREVRKNMNEADLQMEMNTLKDDELGLSRRQKEEIGIWCKNIINWGRLTYLKDIGFSCDLLRYIESNTSLENMCMVGIKRNEDT